MNTARSGIWAALIGVLALLGCAGSGTGSETNFLPCDTDTECESGVCRDGKCDEGGGAGGRGPGAEVDLGARTLSGIWDAIGTRDGTATTAQITLSATELTIEGDGVRISALGEGDRFDVTAVTRYGPDAFTSVRESAGVGDTGIIPLPVLGTFRVLDALDRGCTGAVSGDAISGQCNEKILGQTFSRWPSLRGNVNAVRIAERTSVFGVFGGTWTLTTSDGVSCNITVVGTTMDASCTGHRLDGTLHVDVQGDAITGSTSGGFELSAQRR